MNKVKTTIRTCIAKIAASVDRHSNGRITPNTVTVTGLLCHIPIGLCILQERFVVAGLLLIFFGLFDVLDGELARLQKSSSAFGAFLDSTTDRIKEILIYIAIIVYFAHDESTTGVLLASTALGISVLISYINAAGDIAQLKTKQTTLKTNQTYRTGYAGYEIRTLLIIIGLLTNTITSALIMIIVFGIHTCYARYLKVYRTINAKN